MNVLLLCSQGMSTGMLCEKITQAAKEDGKELHIWAASEIKAREHVGKADLILLGPQIRYLQKRISEMAPGKPVEVIDMMANKTRNNQYHPSYRCSTFPRCSGTGAGHLYRS